MKKILIEHVLLIVWGKFKNIDGMYCRERIIDDLNKTNKTLLKHYIFRQTNP
jgi:hypothetical protein